MFDFDQAVTEWRRQMGAAGVGVKSPELLDELEGHLRDDVEHRVQKGTDLSLAFSEAAQRMGHGDALQREFQIANLNLTETMKLKHKLALLTGIALLAIGIGLILPALAQWRTQATLAGSEMTLLLIGTTISAGGAILGTLGLVEMLKLRRKV